MGLLPLSRRRITACGGHPSATVVHRFDYFYLYGAVEPSTGASFLLELPWLNTDTFQLWVDHFAQAFPDALNLLVLANGALHKAKAWRWPTNMAPVCLPPYSPARNPLERLWRDLKDQLADSRIPTLEELSEAVGGIVQRYSQAPLRSLTGLADFVPAIETALQGRNG